ncbi:uncharacterized protein LOC124146854 [Haliotis rufescens]|uniref:uncharacterized protein LOC124146854 n=1 Tax=Haliotis rufescens TaxID=6454 RepID=UPI00201EB451|nr:uncharacterized protein LOC124146854 [Haliotis rufescens]
MWTMAVFPLLLCIFTTGVVAAEACATCTSTYNDATSAEGSDTDCEYLKTYLDCLETAAGTSAGCDLATAQATKISDAVCDPDLELPCTCQKTFWGSDLSGNNACGPLGTYIQCLTDAGEKVTCKTGVKASAIIDKPKGRLATLTCNAAVSTLRMYSTTTVVLPFILMAFLP